MSFVEKLGKGIQSVFGSYNERYIVKDVIPVVNKINALEKEWMTLSDHDLREKTRDEQKVEVVPEEDYLFDKLN